MINFNKKIKMFAGVAVAAIAFAACNKDPQQFPDTPAVALIGRALGDSLSARPGDSLYARLIIRSGLSATVNDRTREFTLFAPDNNAVIASFGGSLASANATIANIPVASAAGIVSYNLVPQKFPSSAFPETFPNRQLPTSIILDPTNALVRMSIFPSRRGSVYYVNNIPIGVRDIQAANGIIHQPLAIVAPPSRVLKDTIGRVTNLELFRAVIIRGDSGQVGLNRFDSLLNYAVTNMTVLAPNDAAVGALLTALSGGAIPAGSPNLAYVGFINSPFVPAATARGIVAYHLLATNAGIGFQPNIRAFSVNFAPTPTLYTTLVNASVAAHPGVRGQATFTGPVVSALTFTGLGTLPPGGAPFSSPAANVVGIDRHAVNGVFHIIDRVLLPQ